MDYQSLSKDTFDLDRRIRFAAICDRTGEIKYPAPSRSNKSIGPPSVE